MAGAARSSPRTRIAALPRWRVRGGTGKERGGTRAVSNSNTSPESAAAANRAADCWSKILDAQGEYEAALALWQVAHDRIRSCVRTERYPDHGQQFLRTAARLFFNLGRRDEAAEHALAALEGVAEYEGRLLSAIPESHRMRRLDQGRLEVAMLLSTTREQGPATLDPYLQALRWKGRVSRSLVESRGRALRDMEPCHALQAR